MHTVFHTIATTKRHRELGYCEKSDFAKMELIRLTPEEKKLVVRFHDNDTDIELIEFRGKIYKKESNKINGKGMSREDESVWAKKQGKFSDKTAIAFLLEIRKRKEHYFSGIFDDSFIIIGNTLYQDYCNKNELSIGVCGNLTFSYWLSIDIESKNSNKINYKLSKSNFDRVVKKERALFDKGKPAEGTKKGDGHVYFSAPKIIKWGESYK